MSLKSQFYMIVSQYSTNSL